MAAEISPEPSEVGIDNGGEARHLAAVPNPETARLIADLALWKSVLDESAPFMRAEAYDGAQIAVFGERYPEPRRRV